MGKKAGHEAILELLPWFINETLGEKERDLVLGHLRDCQECRLERDRLQNFEHFVRDSDVAIPDHRFAYTKLQARIETAEQNRASTEGLALPVQSTNHRGSNFFPVVGIAASIALVLAFVGLVVPSGNAPVTNPEFTTLTTGPVSIEGTAQRVALTFQQPIQAATMRKALIETHSNIVSGPDADGTYLVEVQVPFNTSVEEYLRSIREIEGVQYARLSE